MTGKTISTSLSSTVTIGTKGYISPLVITSKGTIFPSEYGAAGIYLPNQAGVATIGNNGLVEGGAFYPRYGAAGTAIVLDAGAILTNSGTILGGHAAYNQQYGGYGGIGVSSDVPVTIINNGSILGGYGGTSPTYAGAGGAGVSLGSCGDLSNTHLMIGGAGGESDKFGLGISLGIGGAGLITGTEATVSNTGTITGGAGGILNANDPDMGRDGADGVRGGYGVNLGVGTTLTNSGTIHGGIGGGHYQLTDYGAFGGIGLNDIGATATNTGLIVGGYGGQGDLGGGNGANGVEILHYGSLINQGHVLGGAGGRGAVGGDGILAAYYGDVTNSGQITGDAGGNQYIQYQGGGFGGQGVYLGGGTLTNTGTITGGAGGSGGNVPSNATTISTLGGGFGGIGLVVEPAYLYATATVVNYKLIQGGNGGALTGTSGHAGNGGIGVGAGASTSLTNHGTIIGGTGGYAGALAARFGVGGVGGDGGYLVNGGHLTNTGTIIGGTGGSNFSMGAQGGTGVYLTDGSVFTNTGTVIGGTGGDNKVQGPQGDAVSFGGTIGSTLVAGPGAVFVGDLNPGYLAGSMLELTGSSAVPFVESLNPNVAGAFFTISFGAGAARTVDLAQLGGFIDGFAPHDSIVLPDAAIIADTTFKNSLIEIALTFGTESAFIKFVIPHTLTKDFIITDTGAQSAITAPAAKAATTLGNKAGEFILAGGTATNTTVKTGGLEEIYKGGTAAGATLAGGELLLQIGATLATGVSFTTIKGGDLVLDSAIMPTATITGFAPGDTIALPGIPYAANDSVTVAKAGIVTINAAGKAYNLNIAGATVGETDFHFSSGSVLTKSTAAAKAVMAMTTPAMDFIRPETTPAASLHRETDLSAMFTPIFRDKAATPATTLAARPALGAADSLRTVLDRNQQITIPQHPA